MAKIAFVRLDDRLLHGQVAITILRGVHCKRVIVADDAIAKDTLQKNLLKSVTPRGIKFEAMSSEAIGKSWSENELGKEGPVVILFRDVANIYKAYLNGLRYEKLQIGGYRDPNGRVRINMQVFLNEEEASMLDEINNSGTEVYLQTKMSEKISPWSTVKKFFP